VQLRTSLEYRPWDVGKAKQTSPGQGMAEESIGHKVMKLLIAEKLEGVSAGT
jgi:hypothetical protein